MTTFLVEKERRLRGGPRTGSPSPARSTRWATRASTPPSWSSRATEIAADQVLGGEPGKGFYQMMDGVEVGRVNVAARGCGVANRAFELGVAYAQQRETFGKKIAEHQAVLFRLAEMATKVEAAHQMMVRAARKKDAGERNDLEAGMAKYLAAEYCSQVVEDSFRIHGGYGFSKEYEIERLYREAPMLLIGEGTADIQRMIIGGRGARGLQAPVLRHTPARRLLRPRSCVTSGRSLEGSGGSGRWLQRNWAFDPQGRATCGQAGEDRRQVRRPATRDSKRPTAAAKPASDLPGNGPSRGQRAGGFGDLQAKVAAKVGSGRGVGQAEGLCSASLGRPRVPRCCGRCAMSTSVTTSTTLARLEMRRRKNT